MGRENLDANEGAPGWIKSFMFPNNKVQNGK